MGIDRLEQLRGQYRYQEWAGRTSLQESLAVVQYFVAPGVLQGWTLRRSQRADTGPVTRTELIFTRTSKEADELLHVDVFEGASLAAAHERLLLVLGEFQSGTLTALPDGPGDVAFGFGDFTQVFARANVVVMLRNGGRSLVPVTEPARLIDRDLTSRPEVSPNRVSPDVIVFELPDNQPRAGSPIPIRLEATDPLGRPVWFKVFATEGELRVEDNRLIYQPAAAGSHRLTVFVLNENGGVATRSLDVRVS